MTPATHVPPSADQQQFRSTSTNDHRSVLRGGSSKFKNVASNIKSDIKAVFTPFTALQRSISRSRRADGSGGHKDRDDAPSVPRRPNISLPLERPATPPRPVDEAAALFRLLNGNPTDLNSLVNQRGSTDAAEMPYPEITSWGKRAFLDALRNAHSHVDEELQHALANYNEMMASRNKDNEVLLQDKSNREFLQANQKLSAVHREYSALNTGIQEIQAYHQFVSHSPDLRGAFVPDRYELPPINEMTSDHMATRMTCLEEVNSAMVDQITRLRMELAESKGELEYNKEYIDELGTHLQKLQGQLTSSEAQIANHQAQLNFNRTTAEQAKEDLKRLRRNRADLAAMLTSTCDHVKHMEEVVRKKAAFADELERDNVALARKNVELELANERYESLTSDFVRTSQHYRAEFNEMVLQAKRTAAHSQASAEQSLDLKKQNQILRRALHRSQRVVSNLQQPRGPRGQARPSAKALRGGNEKEKVSRDS